MAWLKLFGTLAQHVLDNSALIDKNIDVIARFNYNVTGFYFSIKSEYSKNAVWLMNDEMIYEDNIDVKNSDERSVKMNANYEAEQMVLFYFLLCYFNLSEPSLY